LFGAKPMKSQTLKRWFLHYNKPASHKLGKPVMTLHWQDACHMVRAVKINTACESHENKRQPRCVIRGWATQVLFTGDLATIN